MKIGKLNQKGFSALEIILIVVVLALVLGTGYYIYSANKKTSETLNTASKTAQSSPSSAPAANPVLFSDSTGTAYQVSLLAKTADQKGIAKALDQQCQTSNTAGHQVVAATGVKDLFTNGDNFKEASGFARLNTACYDKTAGGAQWGGGAAHFLKKTGNQWKYLGGGQAELDCSVFDGTGIPAGIADTCYDSATGASRAPK